jgi:Peptidase MA superfamily
LSRSLLGLIAALLLTATITTLAPSAADAATTIESSSIQNNYPANLVFKVTAHADMNITDVTLVYAIKGTGTSAIAKPKDLTPDKNVSAEVQVLTNSGAQYIPVGSDFLYHWEITSADGAKFVGPDTPFFYLPTGQDWQSVKGDFMVVYYHGDNQDLANAYLTAGVQTYDRMATKLLKTTLTVVPVKVILFSDENESSKARPPTSGKFDATTTTCGTKVTIDIVLVIPQSCGTSDKTDTLRHEFTHIINQTAGESAFGKLPSWIDEGTAVYGQSTPGEGFSGAFQSAVKANRLLPISTMAIAPNEASNVNVFYGESYSLVKYLIDTYGPDKYATFFANIKKGGRFDDVMKATYGFDQAGLESEFRKSLGLPPLQQQASPAATARPSASASATARATATPRPPARPTAAAAASPSSSGSGISKTALAIIGTALVFLLFSVFSLLVAMVLGNNRKQRERLAAGPASTMTASPPEPEKPPSPLE